MENLSCIPCTKRVPSSFIFFLIYLSCITISPSICSSVPRNETDQLALLAFKDRIIQDPTGALSSWNKSLQFCMWEGIRCSRRYQRVMVLNLQARRLVGSLSPDLGNLTFLKELNLGDNNLLGDIPPELGNLHRMRILNLTTNSFGGEIPANLSNCKELRNLDLGTNQLIGNIAVELTTLSKLNVLHLLVNNLTGIIPESISNLTSLTTLTLGRNALQGSIPDGIGMISDLGFLQIAENQLSGMVPQSIYNLSSLKFIAIATNQLHGTLPPNLGLALPQLEFLYVGGNQLSGSIPVSLTNATGFVELDLAYNNFTGSVLSDLGRLGGLEWFNLESNQLGFGEVGGLSFISSLSNCTNLHLLDLNYNMFEGEFPRSISNLTSNLSMLLMGANQIHGSIPEGIGNLVSLTVLRLEENLLTGSIPSSIGKLQKLQLLSLSRNKFSGQIPSSIGNLIHLNELYLQENGLQGNIPSGLGNCQVLEVLDISQNNLNGSIPPQVIGISSLSISLNLSRNSLTGTLPKEVGNLKILGILDISENRLSGEVPSEIGECQSLESLHIEGNLFEGTIPPSLSKLKGIQDIDLSRNNLSGQIPDYLGKLKSIRYLNLSFNEFQGEVPKDGAFENASAVSVLGNYELCGGVAELHLPSCPIEKSREGESTQSLRIIIIVVSVVSGLVLLTCLFGILYWKRRSKKKPTFSSSLGDQHTKVSYMELLKATNQFSSANLIGMGGYGAVYKGILGPNETVVAVKVLKLELRGASKSFIAECEVLRNVRHRNLVKILTSCSSVDLTGNDFKALVFEFMPNGSLEGQLHSQVDELLPSKNLNLVQRLNIAVDVAFALDYLHHQVEQPIIHCDLKPSNVLLNNDMAAKVGDFGLARFLSIDKNPKAQSSSILVKGSIGYVPPEYGMGAGVSTRGDVYSYGILLLEMFTGIRPTHDMFEKGLNLHNFVKENISNEVIEIMDPRMPLEVKELAIETGRNRIEMENIVRDCLVGVIRIGLSCSAESPKERMEMKDVSVQMQAIRKKLLTDGNKENIEELNEELNDGHIKANY